MLREKGEHQTEIFLVRHGKSNAHDGDRRQSPDSPLGGEGVRQAKALAERMTTENIDVIVSSRWDRAFQTAQLVSERLGLEVEVVDGIHEKEQSPKLYGSELTSEIHRRHATEVKKFGNNLDWKFDDEGESLRDLVGRVSRFRDYLIENHRNQNVLVVSHGLFIRTFIIASLLGEDYDDLTFYKIFTSISFDNTSVTLLEYDEKKTHWELKYLNDHSHIK